MLISEVLNQELETEIKALGVPVKILEQLDYEMGAHDSFVSLMEYHRNVPKIGGTIRSHLASLSERGQTYHFSDNRAEGTRLALQFFQLPARVTVLLVQVLQDDESEQFLLVGKSAMEHVLALAPGLQVIAGEKEL